MKIKKLFRETIPFFEVFIAAVIILITIVINRGILYEHKLRTMEYPEGFTAVGISVNWLELDTEGWDPGDMYRENVELSKQRDVVITNFIDYYTELANAPTSDVRFTDLDDLKDIQILGTSGRYFDCFQPRLRSGRYFTAEESNHNLCMIGEGLAKRLFNTIEDSIGQTLRLPYLYPAGYKDTISDLISEGDRASLRAKSMGMELTIVGVVEGGEKLPARTVSWNGIPVETVNVYADDMVILPAGIYEDTSYLFDYYTTFWVEGARNKGQQLASELSGEYTGMIYTVNPELETFFKDSFSERTALYLLNAFAVLVFIVSGMGIMAIQMIAIARRKEEIGLRMAVGARRCDIALLILKETILRFCLPSVLGMIIGVPVIRRITALTGIPVLIDGKTIGTCMVITFLFALCVGLYPAMRASSLNPVNAIGRTPGIN